MPPSDQPAFRVEYPPADTRYLIPPEQPSRRAAEGVELAERFEASINGITVDGKPFPWHIHRVAVQVDVISPGWYVVYVPLLVEGEVVAGEGARDATLAELMGDQAVYDEVDPTSHDFRRCPCESCTYVRDRNAAEHDEPNHDGG